jgi:hypothetical protein
MSKISTVGLESASRSVTRGTNNQLGSKRAAPRGVRSGNHQRRR